MEGAAVPGGTGPGRAGPRRRPRRRGRIFSESACPIKTPDQLSPVFFFFPRLCHDISGKCLESFSICLHARNGNMTRFPGLDLSYDAALACMYTADNFALGPVSELPSWFRLHLSS